MNWKSLFNLRGINYWLLGSGIGLSMIWTFATLMFSFSILTQNSGAVETVQIGLMVSILIGNFLIGWLIGRMADDNRGPTYGLLSSLGSLILIVFVVVPTGILGLLVAVMAVAGGLNGGIFSLRRYRD
jgi:hypothetical protein